MTKKTPTRHAPLTVEEDCEGDVAITWDTPIGQQVVFVPKEAKHELLLWLALDLAATAGLHPVEGEFIKGFHAWLSERLAPKKAKPH